VVKALLADLIERGLRPDIACSFIVDGVKALSRAARDTFGDFALIQRCQVHKGRNIVERLDRSMHAGARKYCVRLGTVRPPSRLSGSQEPGASARS
jgi:putative transposase